MSGAGSFRRRVTLERPVATADGAGGRLVAWEPVAVVWAAVSAERAAEAVVAGRPDGVVAWRVVIRHRDDVLGGMRFDDGGRKLRVLATHDADGRRRRLVCRCEEEGR